MGKHAQLLQQEDVVVLSAVLHEARAAALASSTSTADGDVELSLLEVGKLEHTSSSMNSPRPSCDLRLGEPPPEGGEPFEPCAPHLHRYSARTRPCCQRTASPYGRTATTIAWCSLPPRCHRRPASAPPPLSLLTPLSLPARSCCSGA